MELQIVLADASEAKLQVLAQALYADEAQYLLEGALGDAALGLNLSGERGSPEDEVVIASISKVLATRVSADGALVLEVKDEEKYGEGAECEPLAMLEALKVMTGARFVFVYGQSVARGERFPGYAEIRIDDGIFRARIESANSSGWDVMLPLQASQDQRMAAEKVAKVLAQDGWLLATDIAHPARSAGSPPPT